METGWKCWDPLWQCHTHVALKIKPGANGEKCVGTQGFSDTTWQAPGEDLGLAGAASYVFQMGELLKDAPVWWPWPLDQLCGQGMRHTAQGQAASLSRVNEVGRHLAGTWMFSGWLTSLGQSGRLVHTSHPGSIRKAGGPTADQTVGPPVYTMGAGELTYKIGTLKC